MRIPTATVSATTAVNSLTIAVWITKSFAPDRHWGVVWIRAGRRADSASVTVSATTTATAARITTRCVRRWWLWEHARVAVADSLSMVLVFATKLARDTETVATTSSRFVQNNRNRKAGWCCPSAFKSIFRRGVKTTKTCCVILPSSCV